jgi:hypothetical protein
MMFRAGKIHFHSPVTLSRGRTLLKRLIITLAVAVLFAPTAFADTYGCGSGFEVWPVYRTLSIPEGGSPVERMMERTRLYMWVFEEYMARNPDLMASGFSTTSPIIDLLEAPAGEYLFVTTQYDSSNDLTSEAVSYSCPTPSIPQGATRIAGFSAQLEGLIVEELQLKQVAAAEVTGNIYFFGIYDPGDPCIDPVTGADICNDPDPDPDGDGGQITVEDLGLYFPEPDDPAPPPAAGSTAWYPFDDSSGTGGGDTGGGDTGGGDTGGGDTGGDTGGGWYPYDGPVDVEPDPDYPGDGGTDPGPGTGGESGTCGEEVYCSAFSTEDPEEVFTEGRCEDFIKAFGVKYSAGPNEAVYIDEDTYFVADEYSHYLWHREALVEDVAGDAEQTEQVICGRLPDEDRNKLLGDRDGFWGAFEYEYYDRVEEYLADGSKRVYGIYRVDLEKDVDGDGFLPKRSADDAEGDCNDTYDMTYPGAAEICDGQINDCHEVGNGGRKEFQVFSIIDTFRNLSALASGVSPMVEYSVVLGREDGQENTFGWSLDAPDGDVEHGAGAVATPVWDVAAPGGGHTLRPGGIYTAELTATCQAEGAPGQMEQKTETTFYTTPDLNDCKTVYLHNGMPQSEDREQRMADMESFIEICVDYDGDGYYPEDSPLNANPAEFDCAPFDGNTYPGAVEICDGRINDCNSTAPDEGLLWTEVVLHAAPGGLDISSDREVPFTLRKQSQYPQYTQVSFEVDGTAIDLGGAMGQASADGIPYRWAVPGEGTKLIQSVLGVHTAKITLRCKDPKATEYSELSHAVDFTLYNSDQCKASVRPKAAEDTAGADYDGCCKVEATLGEKELWPRIPEPQDIAVKDWTIVYFWLKNPAPPGGCTIDNISVTPVPFTGMHEHHDASRFKGYVEPNSLYFSEGETGPEVVAYKALIIAGIESITYHLKESDETNHLNITVKVPGLITLTSNDDLVMKCDKYPTVEACYGHGYQHQNYYFVWPWVKGTFEKIAEEYRDEFPNSPRLVVNDASLAWGGLYDVENNWWPPHRTHRFGMDIDIRTRDGDLPQENRDVFEDIVCNNGAFPYPEGHYHLFFFPYLYVNYTLCK